jgi:RNA polymerase sigma-70 factor, ECF subfamily
VKRTLKSAYVIARAAWLAVEVPFETFAAHVQTYAPDLEEHDLERVAGDLYLACACLNAEPTALMVLEQRVIPATARAIRGVSSDPVFVQDCTAVLLQRLLDAPNPQLARYRGQDSLVAWISVVAAGVALEHFRLISTADSTQTLAMEYLDSEVAQGFSQLKEAYGAELQAALQDALASLSARDRNVLRMHVSGHCSIEQIGRAYGVHRAAAARWLAEIRAQVQEQVMPRLGLPALREAEARDPSPLRRKGSEPQSSDHAGRR